MKDPDTGKRVSRPNPPSEWVTTAVPELRIVDDELWNEVKARQVEMRRVTSNGDAKRFNRARRPKYLFSGLTTCAECGGGYVMYWRDRLACFGARSRGTCTNRLTITALNSSVSASQLGILKTATVPAAGQPDVIAGDVLANDTVTLNLPQGPYVKVEGIGVELNIAGQVIGGDFAFEQLTKPNGQRVVKVAVANAHIALGEPGNPILEINQEEGQAALFLITPQGFAGKIEANPCCVRVESSCGLTGGVHVRPRSVDRESHRS